ncbi:MAG: NAD(P)-binding domain-containing protein, partial [Candidatus Eremiobacteraeota bacterium]|nr:NAD(P)-binding domain-containing protein [Candidatus Eremiobacteraeota bacterium]
MRVGVVGAGAIGTLFAYSLACRHDVRVLVRDERRARAIADRGGLVLEGESPRPVRLGSDASLFADVDVTLVAVKAYATIDALRPLYDVLPPLAPIVSLQNGASAVGQIETALGELTAIVLAPTTEAATLLEPGVARRIGRGVTRVGWARARNGGDPAAARIAAAFTAAGLEASFVERIEPYVWGKLVINAAINPVAALAGVASGALLERPELWGRAERAAREAAAG